MNTLAKPKPTRRFRRTRKPKPTTWQGWLIFLAKLLLLTFVMLYLIISVAGSFVFTTAYNRGASSVTPADYQLPYQEISYPAAVDNLTIRGWYVPKSPSRVIIVLHGKDANRGAMLEPAAALAKLGYSLLLIDMRGHGLSDGDHYSYGYYEQRDVQGAVSWLKQRGFQPNHMAIYGASMGASTGLVFMGNNPDIAAMVSDSAYANLPDELAYGLHAFTGGSIPPIFLPGMELAATIFQGLDVNAVRPEESVKHLNGRHLLLIHGTADKLVPVDNAYRLQQAAGPLADLWIVPGAAHTGSYATQPQPYIQHLTTFFLSYFPIYQAP